jgi:hypothetical protein
MDLVEHRHLGDTKSRPPHGDPRTASRTLGILSVHLTWTPAARTRTLGIMHILGWTLLWRSSQLSCQDVGEHADNSAHESYIHVILCLMNRL